MEEKQTLHVICPRQLHAAPMILCVACSAVLFSAFSKPRPIDAGAYLFFAVSLVMILLILAILYRNLIFRDELYIVRGTTVPSKRGALCLDAADVVSVQVLPPSNFASFEWRMEWLGLGGGRIEIHTKTHRFNFGVGLHDSSFTEIFEKIAVFCELRNDQPAAAASVSG